eukprot:983895-Amphidinium_carterae.1
MEDDLMWLAPFVAQPQQSSQQNTIKIDLHGPMDVAGFHVWNYNKHVDDTCRGVKERTCCTCGM